MTLIARFMIGQSPVYLGDLLVSSPSDHPAPDINIPAADNINSLLPKDAPRRVTTLTQKINLLHDRLIVAWAGSLPRARRVLKDLQNLALRDDFSLTSARMLIEALPDSETHDLSLIGTILTPNDGGALAEHFQVNVVQWLSDDETEIAVEGSGTATLVELLPQIKLASVPPADPNSMPVWSEATALGVAAQFIGHEMMTGQNLLDWWGGGIELAMFRQGRFEKLGNMLHTFWRVDSDEDSLRLALISKFIKYDYISDALCIQKFDCAFNGATEVSVRAYDSVICLPLLSRADDYGFRLEHMPDLSSAHVCCYVRLPAGPNYVHVDYNRVRFVVEPQSGFLKIGLEQTLIRDLCRAIELETKKPVRSVGITS